MKRCDWATNELEQLYHDYEWGKPLHDEAKLFEMLVLESMQAGLSWSTILKKRESMREAFDSFDYHKIADYQEDKILALLANPGVIRHRKKIEALINNAQAYLKIQEKYGSFDIFIWQFVEEPIINQWQNTHEVPASTELAKTISKELKQAGFKFLGPTSVYAFMQSVGMVNDHLISCSFK
ncbi:DNA-3-methyladenine glycosylase I [Enterococcus sp. DIV2402]|uniref:DNA-3-methyladenine glycosylase I n=1 Tax=Candidatus Enterococcus lowellii TaxID=2230877 RepID=A0ABZ2SP40_9ENTE|nr:DNA-3-methyladenine glycosylase I [Enterococcus sp. DIV2402]MBO0463686.1 DNA-3-methyladenine glycosylase I [Enterococcus sp. DIV2402]